MQIFTRLINSRQFNHDNSQLYSNACSHKLKLNHRKDFLTLDSLASYQQPRLLTLKNLNKSCKQLRTKHK